MTAGVPPPGPPTVWACFSATAERYPEHAFLHVVPETAQALGVEARTWTYAQAHAQVERLIAIYRSAGYGHGHRGGVMLSNRPDFLFHFLAMNALGISVVPINTDWRAAELEYLIAHSEICVAVCLPPRKTDLDAAAAAARIRLAVWTPHDTQLAPASTPAPAHERAPDTDTECALLYTSGTTGRPKGCVLPNEYFLYAGQWYNEIGGMCQVRPGVERMITPLPLTHMNALAVSTMCMITSGGCLVLLDRFHPRSWWQSVRESRATIVHYLGVMPAMLLSAAESPEDRSHLVRFGFGAGVNPRHHAAFEARFGFPLVEAWAMTETGSGAVIVANREPRSVGTACFGRPAPAVECRIVDEHGADVPDGAPGELLVRYAGRAPGFGFFRRYLKDDTATAEAWAGGWFHTGDLVTRDGHGDFRFVDRKKNVIRRSGENISAVEVESVLSQLQQVRAVGVTAVPDPVRGDEVFACVVAHSDVDDPDGFAREVVNYCLERLAYFKAPGYVALCRELPLTATEKIQRAGLKALALDLLQGQRCVDVRSLKRREGS